MHPHMDPDGLRLGANAGAVPDALPDAVRILAVDDDPGTAEATETLLQMEGYETRVASLGSEALELVRTFKPHGVILDLRLPDMCGDEVARRVRAMPGGDSVRLVAASGERTPGLEAELRAAGFDAHFLKPVDFRALCACLPPSGRSSA